MLHQHIPIKTLNNFANFRRQVWSAYQRYAHIFPRQLLRKAESNEGVGVWASLNLVVTWCWSVLYSRPVLPEDPFADSFELVDMHEVLRTQIMPNLHEVQLNSTLLGGHTELLAYTEQTLKSSLAHMNRGKPDDIKPCFVCVRSSQKQAAMPCSDHEKGASATLSSVTGFGSSSTFGSTPAFGPFVTGSRSPTGFGQVFTGTM